MLADDKLLTRAVLRVLLEGEEDIAVTGETSDGEQAVALARATRPDVILMDIRMPGLDGVEATRRIAGDVRLSGVRILILTTFESDEYVSEALHALASGFLVKNGNAAEVLVAWRERGRLAPALLGELTDREREVMALVAYGLTNPEIAERLVISPATAKAYVSRTMRKLHAHDRAQLVVLAYLTGLVVRGGSAESAAADRIADRARSTSD
jgi:DNA-binding NarL/FixJ family response regulator